MPADQTTVIVTIGDDSPPEELQMAEPVDLPANVANAFLVESIASSTQVAKDARSGASAAMTALTAGLGLAHVLLGTAGAARAVSGINATDLGGPVNKSGQ